MRRYHIKDEILWHKPLCDFRGVQLVGVGEVRTMTFVAALIEFHCDICGNNFKSVRNLKTHTTAKHQLLKSSSTDFAKSVETNGMWLALWKCNQLPNTNFSNYHSFPCDKCGIIFNLVCTLKMHIANFVNLPCCLSKSDQRQRVQLPARTKSLCLNTPQSMRAKTDVYLASQNSEGKNMINPLKFKPSPHNSYVLVRHCKFPPLIRVS